MYNRMMKILIVIVNYNGLNLLKKNLPSVVGIQYPNFDVVVVDNASIDSSVEYLGKEFPTVKVVASKENTGYGRGNNLGVNTYPNYDAYLFLNNDVSVPKDFLGKMVKVLESSNEIGVVGPKVLYSKKSKGKYIINSAGVEIDSHFLSYDRYDGKIDSERYSVIEEVDAVMGGAFLVKREVFEKSNGFSDKMFLYYEDIDLSLRIRDLGYKIYYVGTSCVYHDHMASSKKLSIRRRNMMNKCNRYKSLKERYGIVVAIRETIWYFYNWFIWKMIYSNQINLEGYLSKKQ